jgi:hypothetical protein
VEGERAARSPSIPLCQTDRVPHLLLDTGGAPLLALGRQWGLFCSDWREDRATSASAAGGAPGSPERSAGENREGAPSPGRRRVRSDRAGSLGTKEKGPLPLRDLHHPLCPAVPLVGKVQFRKGGLGDFFHRHGLGRTTKIGFLNRALWGRQAFRLAHGPKPSALPRMLYSHSVLCNFKSAIPNRAPGGAYINTGSR